ncbi:hypothetical protein AJ79_08856 [Helicocarpus griseus UAMH5409]|uniref:DNA-directed RNA polymerase subunit n=1 Tax=Helicocarpus griseus UAMH5409 TaxID=1447875 RepID=A0A2B7WPC1_9EURO|nr:hypothetical protein AJ79_08856 [Helicocarpus griseus UAMH5409]
MDIDPAPLSPERKRKNKEKESRSSKKRKQESSTAAQPEIEETSAKTKKKEKKKEKKHKKHEEPESIEPTLPDASNARSKKTKKHKHKPQESDDEQEQATSAQSPKASRKHSSKTSVSKPGSTSTDAANSPFHLITASLYVPLSPISISPTHALSSLEAEHLSPLLLTYYPPLRGLVLAYSDTSMSSTPPPSAPASTSSKDDSQLPTLAVSAGEYGVLYVYLAATFLIFRPERGQELEACINVQSDGFLGAVVYNLFSVGIERRRLPQDWEWVAPGQESETDAAKSSEGDDEIMDSDFDSDTEHFRPLPASATNDPSNDTQTSTDPYASLEDSASGYFRTRSGKRVRGMIRFRVRDVDVIPGAEHDKGFMSIEGTMLSVEEEAKLLEEERRKAGFAPSSTRNEVAEMSGALGSTVATAVTVRDEAEAGATASVSKKQGKEKGKKKAKKAAS